MKPYILTLRNLEQAAAWLELAGQISDGFWENSRPYDHWKPWADAAVLVDTVAIGRNFFTPKSNYNFVAPELLEVIGMRMLGTVRIARCCGIEVAAVLHHYIDCGTGLIDWKDASLALNQKIFQNSIITATIDSALISETYTMKHLKADLRDMKKIIKVRA